MRLGEERKAVTGSIKRYADADAEQTPTLYPA
jgi:hypothetical protein